MAASRWRAGYNPPAVRFYVGTSGYSYKEWCGSFYPEDLKPPGMLGYYAERLKSVEINNTFYRMPNKRLLQGWAGKVPDDFSFVLKVTRRITHHKRLKDAGEELSYLLETSAVLGSRLGPMLFQLPPYLRKDAARLTDFVTLLPEGFRGAFEFRHPSWLDDEVFEVLASRDLALVIADTGTDKDPPFVATAGYGYLRLRRPGYGDEALAAWAEKVATQEWSDAWAFFKHEDEGAGPRMAKRFSQMLEKTL